MWHDLIASIGAVANEAQKTTNEVIQLGGVLSKLKPPAVPGQPQLGSPNSPNSLGSPNSPNSPNGNPQVIIDIFKDVGPEVRNVIGILHGLVAHVQETANTIKNTTTDAANHVTKHVDLEQQYFQKVADSVAFLETGKAQKYLEEYINFRTQIINDYGIGNLNASTLNYMYQRMQADMKYVHDWGGMIGRMFNFEDLDSLLQYEKRTKTTLLGKKTTSNSTGNAGNSNTSSFDSTSLDDLLTGGTKGAF